jgi:hypothetical protein
MPSTTKRGRGRSRLLFAVIAFALFHDMGVAMSRTLPENRFFTSGDSVPVTVCKSAVCNIRNTGAVLDGIDIHMEPPVFEMKVSLNNGKLRLPDGRAHQNPVIELSFDVRLQQPVRVSVPMGGRTTPPVCFAISEDGALSALVYKSDDDGRFSFYTFKPGRFTWID